MLLGGTFYGIKKLVGRKQEGKTKSELEAKIVDLEKEITQLQEELKKVTDSVQKQNLETKIKQSRQKLTSLKSQLNPRAPPPPTPPQKTNRQFTIECSGSIGVKYEFINVSNPQEKILIDARNPIIFSGNFYICQGDQYTVSFKEEDVTKEKGYFVFDKEDDNKFQLTPLTPSPTPPPSNPNPNPSGEIKTVCK